MIHKKRKKNASFGFSGHIQGRFRPFPACFGRFSTCFGHISRRPIRPNMADTARFWPNQPGLARIEADSARIEPHRRESKSIRHESSRISANQAESARIEPSRREFEKKKKRRRGPTRGQPRRTQVPTSGATSMLSRLISDALRIHM